MLLDEPTVHLDLRHQVEAMELLVDLNAPRRDDDRGGPPRPRASPRTSSRASCCSTAADSSPTGRPPRCSRPSAIREVFGVDPAFVRLPRRQRLEPAAASASRAIASTVFGPSPFCDRDGGRPETDDAGWPRRVSRRRPAPSRRTGRLVPASSPPSHPHRRARPGRTRYTARPPRGRPRPPTPAERRDAARRREHPGPELRDRRGRQHPGLRLVEDLAAEKGRVRLVDRRAAGRGHQVGIAAASQHRERHPPDVAGRGRVGRVEVAVGVEPRDGEPSSRVARHAARPSHRHARCSRHRG